MNSSSFKLINSNKIDIICFCDILDSIYLLKPTLKAKSLKGLKL